MKVKIQQFLFGKNMSWSLVGHNLGRSFLKFGHEVHFISTDGINEKYTPKDLIPYIKDKPDNIYDIQLSYTAPLNWNKYFINGTKNRFAIWNYEYRGSNLLPGFAKYYKYVDKVLPSSNFTKEVFLDMKMPEENMVVVPHGVYLEEFSLKNKFPLKTNKKVKILLNIAQPHKRKAIPKALEAYGKAFTKDDDVCLVAKVYISNNKKYSFDIDFFNILANFKKQFPKHAEIEVVTEYITNIVEIYNACDINFSATHCECWHLPSLEALATGLINIVPRYGGQLDFCNDDNSLLIDGKQVRAPRDHQYWTSSPYAYHFDIDINDAVNKLRKAYKECDSLKLKFASNMKKTVNEFTWDNAAKQILELLK